MKYIKIILINIVLVFAVLVIIEAIFYTKEFWYMVSNNKWYGPETKINITKYLKKFFYDEIKGRYFKNYYYHQMDFREPAGIEKYPPPSIILFGCSYTYGTNLNNEEALHSKLSSFVKHPVYNLGISGGSPREILYILKGGNNTITNFNIDKNNVEYVIYIYIRDHQRRIHVNQRPLVPSFNKENNKLFINKHDNFLQKSIAYNRFAEKYYDYRIWAQNKSWDEYVIYINEISKEIQKTFKNGNKKTKFIILEYSLHGNENWTKLEDKNIQIINLTDIVSFDPTEMPYIVWEKDNHPSALAWDLIIPNLIKEIKTE